MLVISSGYLYFEVLYLIKEKIRAKNKRILYIHRVRNRDFYNKYYRF